jgi:hypothetical protein
VRSSPRLAVNLDPPDLSLPRSQDYRAELLVPGLELVFDEPKPEPRQGRTGGARPGGWLNGKANGLPRKAKASRRPHGSGGRLSSGEEE